MNTDHVFMLDHTDCNNQWFRFFAQLNCTVSTGSLTLLPFDEAFPGYTVLSSLILQNNPHLPSTPVVLTLWSASELPRELIQKGIAGPTLEFQIQFDLRWSLRICISNKFSKDADAASQETTLWEPLVCTKYFAMKFCVILNYLLFFSHSNQYILSNCAINWC